MNVGEHMRSRFLSVDLRGEVVMTVFDGESITATVVLDDDPSTSYLVRSDGWWCLNIAPELYPAWAQRQLQRRRSGGARLWRP